MAAPRQNLSFAITFSPSHNAPPKAPMVVFTLSGLKNWYVVEADGSTDPATVTTTQIINMPPKCVNVPLYYLFAPHLWHQTASSILSSSGYFLPSTAPRTQSLLRYLCDHVPAHVDDAYLQGYTRVDVNINVRMWVPVVRRRRRLLVPASFHRPVPSAEREESDQETRRRENVVEIMDPSLEGQYSMKEVIQVAAIAAMCVQPESDYRPLMADVVQSLQLETWARYR
ncbi:hypothetical protein H6P81_010323 [Aristolochia fimbriata]|uniref:Uncharacterized protein n=1 Tax=Aristolochia fimbriata TaxID=158543 RepID=A0AAV7ENN6_ARIFI|nr:hypothetical protein H6P81_010323 [Aristolochia fimbriata]